MWIRRLYFIIFVIFSSSVAFATQYLYIDMESFTCDADLPNPPFYTGTQCKTGQTRCSISTPNGDKYAQWNFDDDCDNDLWHEVGSNYQNLPASFSTGDVIYFGVFFRIERIGGNDVWHDGVDGGTSTDKAFYLKGAGLHWTNSLGVSYPLDCLDDHTFTVGIGNPTDHLNPDLEANFSGIYIQNVDQYSVCSQDSPFGTGDCSGGIDCRDTYIYDSGPFLCSYERWYAIVFEIKLATEAQHDGYVKQWVNGVQTMNHTGIATTSSASPTITLIDMFGTIAQPARDAPDHIRQIDGIIITDSYSDITDGGYLQDPESDPETPSITGITISELRR